MTTTFNNGLPFADAAPGANDPGLPVRAISPVSGNTKLPAGAVTVRAASGNVTNNTASAALPAVAAKTNYLTGFIVTASGASSGLIVNGTITGLLGGTYTFTFGFPAGVLVMAVPLVVMLDTPMPASAVNTAITISLPAGGTGNTNAAVEIQGYVV